MQNKVSLTSPTMHSTQTLVQRFSFQFCLFNTLSTLFGALSLYTHSFDLFLAFHYTYMHFQQCFAISFSIPMHFSSIAFTSEHKSLISICTIIVTSSQCVKEQLCCTDIKRTRALMTSALSDSRLPAHCIFLVCLSF